MRPVCGNIILIHHDMHRNTYLYYIYISMSIICYNQRKKYSAIIYIYAFMVVSLLDKKGKQFMKTKKTSTPITRMSSSPWMAPNMNTQDKRLHPHQHEHHAALERLPVAGEYQNIPDILKKITDSWQRRFPWLFCQMVLARNKCNIL